MNHFFCGKILRHLVQAFLRCSSPQEIADFIIKSALNSMLTVQLFGKQSDFEQRQVNTLGWQVVLTPKNSCENLCSFLSSPLNTSPTAMYELFHIYTKGAKVPFLHIIHSKSSKGSRSPRTVIVLTVMIRRCLSHCLSVYYVQSLLLSILDFSTKTFLVVAKPAGRVFILPHPEPLVSAIFIGVHCPVLLC